MRSFVSTDSGDVPVGAFYGNHVVIYPWPAAHRLDPKRNLEFPPENAFLFQSYRARLASTTPVLGPASHRIPGNSDESFRAVSFGARRPSVLSRGGKAGGCPNRGEHFHSRLLA